ncbi:hypothetical protein AGABI1DRAFT_115646 [Agaricus bisporus var. burnettii JB137-S8]|uniref:AB hydrolase-1 domain-containing protein n=1 Tax=Agaricus bisporus var. burnettii (strain JB137-S8 / ATCC MYA-4627 / FGSC 10392) TaxID=597362 RepID=K5X1I7_AGABU|nr:uncharacterized protein AGABI1DRAFT_115646 [Agaricus bisporus var. burnettii JB137-S8]EKM76772.1 hypothetical protein AGABI1DRAFT_115646 [Agaricus bisporus var. burnettii JB137-S8]
MPAPELSVAKLANGVEMAYLDSGPVPDSNDFVTIVWVHGFLFNAYSIERLLPFAHQCNIRLIIVMRRDYPGSSRYTDEEMVLATENPELFFSRAGVLYLQFMHHILKNTSVCKPTMDRSKGGICLAGWSLGNSFAMCALCENELVDKKVYDDLEPYFTAYIFIEPPTVALGVRRSGEENMYDPLRAKDGMENFRLWITSYFNHPSPWDGTLTKLDQHGNSGRIPSISTWTDAEIERWLSNSGLRSDSLVMLNDVSQSWLTKMSNEIFLGKPKVFPDLRIEYLCGSATCWYCVLPWDTFSTKRAELSRKGEDTDLRRVKFTLIPGNNHFMHTDAPEDFMKIIKTSLEEQSDAYTTL